MNKVLVSLVTLGLLGSSTSLAQYSGPRVTLRYNHGHTGPDLPTMQKLIAAFNASHPNIVIQAEAIPWSTLIQQLPAQVASGRAPDIAGANEPDISNLATRGVITELTPAMLSSARIDPKRFFPALLNTGSYNGRVYGLPHYSAAFVMYYNRDLMARMGVTKAPATRAEFLAAAQRCTTDTSGRRPGQAGFDASKLATWGMGVPTPWVGGTIAYSVLIQNGGALTDRAGNPTLDTAAARNALTFLTDLVTRYRVSPTGATEASEQTAFRQGKTCFNIGGNWLLDQYRGQTGLNFGIAPFPQLGTVREAAWGGSGYVVLPRQPANYDANKRAAALEFMGWLTSPAQNLTWTTAGSLPSQPAVARNPEYARNPLSAVASSLDNVIAHAGFPWILTVRDEFDRAFEATLLGKSSAADALRTAQATATQKVQQARANLR